MNFRRALSSAVVLLVCTVLTAQIKIIPESELKQSTSPRLSADSSALLFDSVLKKAPAMREDSGRVDIEFKVKNVSDRSITISHTRTSCSCLSVRPGKSVLKSGESTTLTAVYDPKGHPGKFQRKIFVYTLASPKDPAAVLGIDAEVQWAETSDERFPYKCGSLKLSRKVVEISGGKAEEIHIRCLNSSPKALRISAETAFASFVEEFSCSPSELPSGSEGMIIIRIKEGEIPAGDYPVILKGTGGRPSESRITLRKTE